MDYRQDLSGESRSRPPVEVFVFQAARFLGSRCFSQSTITIGSGTSATLRLQDSAISDQHAILRVEGGDVVLAAGDKDSLTLVNDERIDVRQIHSYDEVQVGPFRLKVSLLGDTPVGIDTPQMLAEKSPESHPPTDGYDESAQTQVMRKIPSSTPLITDNSSRDQSSSGGQSATMEVPERYNLDIDAQPAHSPGRHSEIQRQPTPYNPAQSSSQPGTAPYQPPNSPHRVGALDPEIEDWDDDDDDDDLTDTFSLLENVVSERFKTPAATETFTMLEVIRYHSGELVDVLRADPGQIIRLPFDDFILARVRKGSNARLFFRRNFQGSIVRHGKAQPLNDLMTHETLIDKKKEIHAVDLHRGDFVQVIVEGQGYLARFVRPPHIPNARPNFRPSGQSLQILTGSIVFHAMILLLLGFTQPQNELELEPNDKDAFVKIAMKDLQLEKPPPPPPPKPKPKPKPAPPSPKKTTKAPRVKKKRVIKRRTRRPKTLQKARRESARRNKQKKQVANVLSALQNISAKAPAGRSNLKSLVTNVAAVRAPSGTRSSFKISGVISKVPGTRVRMSGGSKSNTDTRGARQLLAGRKIGNIASKRGTGTIRGRVSRAPSRQIRATGGTLSRSAIQRVVAKHMNRVQSCYERQLLKTRGLSGKAVFDWIISRNGSVKSARQVSSTLRSAGVSMCILREIRKWRFPKPVGGAVTVRYPFVFRVRGF